MSVMAFGHNGLGRFDHFEEKKCHGHQEASL